MFLKSALIVAAAVAVVAVLNRFPQGRKVLGS